MVAVMGNLGYETVVVHLISTNDAEKFLNFPLASPVLLLLLLLLFLLPYRASPLHTIFFLLAILSVALGNPTPTPHFTSTRAQKDRREEQKLLRLPNSASIHHLPFSLPVEIVSVVNRMDVGDV